MAMPTGPTAHVAPVYPILMGAVYRAFGDGETGETIKQILASCVSSAAGAAAGAADDGLGAGPRCSADRGLNQRRLHRRPGDGTQGRLEGPLAANVLLLLVLWGLRVARPTPQAAREGLCYGAAWGVALLISPALLPSRSD